MIYTDEELEEKWDKLGDVPVVEDAASLKESSQEGLSLEEGGLLLCDEPYIDEEFDGWPRGTSLDLIWEWFDQQYSAGLSVLMYKGWQ